MNGAVIPHTPIAVDFWRVRECPGAKVFFLTHLHGDHTSGLKPSWSRPIFCTPISKKLLMHKFQIKEKLIHALDENESHVIPLDEEEKETMTVTVIDANHCPGSAMFLFQGYFGTILHTGDFRYSEKMFIDTPLRTKRVIDILYLDNTYSSSECDFPTRRQAMEQVFDILDKYPEHQILVGMRSLGKEDLLVAMAFHIETWVVVTGDQYELLRAMDMPNVFTTDRSAGRIHVFPVHHLNSGTLGTWNNQHPTIGIIPTALYCGSTNPYQFQPGIFVIPYSDHSSYAELHRFVEKIRPKKITPVVSAKSKGPYGQDISERGQMRVYRKYMNLQPVAPFKIPRSVERFMKQNNFDVFSLPPNKRKRNCNRMLSRKRSKVAMGVSFEDDNDDSVTDTNEPVGDNNNLSPDHDLSSDGAISQPMVPEPEDRMGQDPSTQENPKQDILSPNDQHTGIGTGWKLIPIDLDRNIKSVWSTIGDPVWYFQNIVNKKQLLEDESVPVPESNLPLTSSSVVESLDIRIGPDLNVVSKQGCNEESPLPPDLLEVTVSDFSNLDKSLSFEDAKELGPSKLDIAKDIGNVIPLYINRTPMSSNSTPCPSDVDDFIEGRACSFNVTPKTLPSHETDEKSVEINRSQSQESSPSNIADSVNSNDAAISKQDFPRLRSGHSPLENKKLNSKGLMVCGGDRPESNNVSIVTLENQSSNVLFHTNLPHGDPSVNDTTSKSDIVLNNALLMQTSMGDNALNTDVKRGARTSGSNVECVNSENQNLVKDTSPTNDKKSSEKESIRKKANVMISTNLPKCQSLGTKGDKSDSTNVAHTTEVSSGFPDTVKKVTVEDISLGSEESSQSEDEDYSVGATHTLFVSENGDVPSGKRAVLDRKVCLGNNLKMSTYTTEIVEATSTVRSMRHNTVHGGKSNSITESSAPISLHQPENLMQVSAEGKSREINDNLPVHPVQTESSLVQPPGTDSMSNSCNKSTLENTVQCSGRFDGLNIERNVPQTLDKPPTIGFDMRIEELTDGNVIDGPALRDIQHLHSLTYIPIGHDQRKCQSVLGEVSSTVSDLNEYACPEKMRETAMTDMSFINNPSSGSIESSLKQNISRGEANEDEWNSSSKPSELDTHPNKPDVVYNAAVSYTPDVISAPTSQVTVVQNELLNTTDNDDIVYTQEGAAIANNVNDSCGNACGGQVDNECADIIPNGNSGIDSVDSYETTTLKQIQCNIHNAGYDITSMEHGNSTAQVSSQISQMMHEGNSIDALGNNALEHSTFVTEVNQIIQDTSDIPAQQIAGLSNDYSVLHTLDGSGQILFLNTQNALAESNVCDISQQDSVCQQANPQEAEGTLQVVYLGAHDEANGCENNEANSEQVMYYCDPLPNNQSAIHEDVNIVSQKAEVQLPEFHEDVNIVSQEAVVQLPELENFTNVVDSTIGLDLDLSLIDWQKLLDPSPPVMNPEHCISDVEDNLLRGDLSQNSCVPNTEYDAGMAQARRSEQSSCNVEFAKFIISRYGRESGLEIRSNVDESCPMSESVPAMNPAKPPVVGTGSSKCPYPGPSLPIQKGRDSTNLDQPKSHQVHDLQFNHISNYGEDQQDNSEETTKFEPSGGSTHSKLKLLSKSARSVIGKESANKSNKTLWKSKHKLSFRPKKKPHNATDKKNAVSKSKVPGLVQESSYITKKKSGYDDDRVIKVYDIHGNEVASFSENEEQSSSSEDPSATFSSNTLAETNNTATAISKDRYKDTHSDTGLTTHEHCHADAPVPLILIKNPRMSAMKAFQPSTDSTDVDSLNILGHSTSESSENLGNPNRSSVDIANESNGMSVSAVLCQPQTQCGNALDDRENISVSNDDLLGQIITNGSSVSKAGPVQYLVTNELPTIDVGDLQNISHRSISDKKKPRSYSRKQKISDGQGGLPSPKKRGRPRKLPVNNECQGTADILTLKGSRQSSGRKPKSSSQVKRVRQCAFKSTTKGQIRETKKKRGKTQVENKSMSDLLSEIYKTPSTNHKSSTSELESWPMDELKCVALRGEISKKNTKFDPCEPMGYDSNIAGNSNPRKERGSKTASPNKASMSDQAACDDPAGSEKCNGELELSCVSSSIIVDNSSKNDINEYLVPVSCESIDEEPQTQHLLNSLGSTTSSKTEEMNIAHCINMDKKQAEQFPSSFLEAIKPSDNNKCEYLMSVSSRNQCNGPETPSVFDVSKSTKPSNIDQDERSVPVFNEKHSKNLVSGSERGTPKSTKTSSRDECSVTDSDTKHSKNLASESTLGSSKSIKCLNSDQCSMPDSNRKPSKNPESTNELSHSKPRTFSNSDNCSVTDSNRKHSKALESTSALRPSKSTKPSKSDECSIPDSGRKHSETLESTSALSPSKPTKSSKSDKCSIPDSNRTHRKNIESTSALSSSKPTKSSNSDEYFMPESNRKHRKNIESTSALSPSKPTKSSKSDEYFMPESNRKHRKNIESTSALSPSKPTKSSKSDECSMPYSNRKHRKNIEPMSALDSSKLTKPSNSDECSMPDSGRKHSKSIESTSALSSIKSTKSSKSDECSMPDSSRKDRKNIESTSALTSSKPTKSSNSDECNMPDSGRKRSKNIESTKALGTSKSTKSSNSDECSMPDSGRKCSKNIESTSALNPSKSTKPSKTDKYSMPDSNKKHSKNIESTSAISPSKSTKSSKSDEYSIPDSSRKHSKNIESPSALSPSKSTKSSNSDECLMPDSSQKHSKTLESTSALRRSKSTKSSNSDECSMSDSSRKHNVNLEFTSALDSSKPTKSSKNDECCMPDSNRKHGKEPLVKSRSQHRLETQFNLVLPGDRGSIKQIINSPKEHQSATEWHEGEKVETVKTDINQDNKNVASNSLTNNPTSLEEIPRIQSGTDSCGQYQISTPQVETKGRKTPSTHQNDRPKLMDANGKMCQRQINKHSSITREKPTGVIPQKCTSLTNTSDVHQANRCSSVSTKERASMRTVKRVYKKSNDTREVLRKMSRCVSSDWDSQTALSSDTEMEGNLKWRTRSRFYKPPVTSDGDADEESLVSDDDSYSSGGRLNLVTTVSMTEAKGTIKSTFNDHPVPPQNTNRPGLISSKRGCVKHVQSHSPRNKPHAEMREITCDSETIIDRTTENLLEDPDRNYDELSTEKYQEKHSAICKGSRNKSCQTESSDISSCERKSLDQRNLSRSKSVCIDSETVIVNPPKNTLDNEIDLIVVEGEDDDCEVDWKNMKTPDPSDTDLTANDTQTNCEDRDSPNETDDDVIFMGDGEGFKHPLNETVVDNESVIICNESGMGESISIYEIHPTEISVRNDILDDGSSHSLVEHSPDDSGKPSTDDYQENELDNALCDYEKDRPQNIPQIAPINQSFQTDGHSGKTKVINNEASSSTGSTSGAQSQSSNLAPLTSNSDRENGRKSIKETSCAGCLTCRSKSQPTLLQTGKHSFVILDRAHKSCARKSSKPTARKRVTASSLKRKLEETKAIREVNSLFDIEDEESVENDQLSESRPTSPESIESHPDSHTSDSVFKTKGSSPLQELTGGKKSFKKPRSFPRIALKEKDESVQDRPTGVNKSVKIKPRKRRLPTIHRRIINSVITKVTKSCSKEDRSVKSPKTKKFCERKQKSHKDLINVVLEDGDTLDVLGATPLHESQASLPLVLVPTAKSRQAVPGRLFSVQKMIPPNNPR